MQLLGKAVFVLPMIVPLSDQSKWVFATQVGICYYTSFFLEYKSPKCLETSPERLPLL